MTVNQKIKELRKYLAENDVSAYIIPSSDPHQSEYVADRWKSREWISGFSGSAGTVVVSEDHAGLWTDSRYFIQADQELAGSEIVLHKMVNQFSPGYTQWLIDNMPAGAVVAIDGDLFSKASVNTLQKKCKDFGLKLRTDLDLIEKAWSDRLDLPISPIFEQPVSLVGKSRVEKLEEIRKEMKKYRGEHYFVSTLDDIAWIYNIRGRDVDYNPVVISYTLISQDSAKLFINPEKVPTPLRRELENEGIEIFAYSSIEAHLNQINEAERVLIDPVDCSNRMARAINSKDVLEIKNISRLLKAVKNEVEMGHLRKVMVKDGVALTKCFMWMEKTLEERAIPEAELADKLAEFRSQQEGYFGESFAAIVGYKGNGAIVHYGPDHATCADIKKEGMLLVDSGGQYTDGTTDITRTFSLSDPSEEEKRNFTLVLKGHINLAKAIFPKGTIGGQLDILARKALWDHGLNYLHGTGHGVGFFMNVHEPPQGFTAGSSTRSNSVFVPGMYTSNEPGYYKEDAYGIRIENLILTRESDVDGFLEHETITLFPISLKLIQLDLITNEEKEWLNSYHKMVEERLSPALNDEEKQWIRDRCKAI
jgi:Xaa-Pro aminopeptidase